MFSGSANAAESLDEGMPAESQRAAVVEGLFVVVGSSVGKLSKRRGGVFSGSSISIGVATALLLKEEAFSFLLESTAADELP